MKPYASRLTVIAAVMLAVLAMVPAMYAHADKAGAALRDARLLNITLGKGDVIDVPGDIADVLLANPAIADVVALQSRKLYIVGSQLGNTNLTLLDQTGSVMAQYDIHVKIDERSIQDYLKQLYPDEKVKVKALNGQIILTGTVSNPATASKISQVVAAYMGEAVGRRRGAVDDMIVNLLQVTGEQQVMLKVKVFEASKTLLRELGLETRLDTVGSGFGGNLDAGILSDGAAKLTRNPLALGALVFNDGNLGPLSLLARALEDQNLAHILAEPNLTAISGEEAGFLAGGEFPVPAGRDNEGNVIIQFRSFGVSLNFRPVVMSENRISLQLNTEVSSLARDQSVTISGLDIPGLNVRRASTTVEVPSGGGLMIAGLLESQAVKGMAGLPGIKDVPVLGDLVSSRSFSRDESELIVLITAYLVKPYAEQVADMKRAELDHMNAAYRPPVMPKIAAQPVPVVEEMQTVAVRPLGAPVVPAPTPAAATVAPAEGAPLTRSFANNIRRIYGRKAPAILDDDQQRFGYLVQ